jgi:hypothetical protein
LERSVVTDGRQAAERHEANRQLGAQPSRQYLPQWRPPSDKQWDIIARMALTQCNLFDATANDLMRQAPAGRFRPYSTRLATVRGSAWDQAGRAMHRTIVVTIHHGHEKLAGNTSRTQ